MSQVQIIYPDISDILARKEEGRREISRRSFGEKIAMVEAMQERLAPLKRIREGRRANRKSVGASQAVRHALLRLIDEAYQSFGPEPTRRATYWASPWRYTP